MKIQSILAKLLVNYCVPSTCCHRQALVRDKKGKYCPLLKLWMDMNVPFLQMFTEVLYAPSSMVGKKDTKINMRLCPPSDSTIRR